MFKKCRYCKHIEAPDTDDVSGFYCKRNTTRITEWNESAQYCLNYKFSWLKLIFGV